MKNKIYYILPLVILYGLMAGFFYAYSISVLLGLNDIAPASAIEAMQGINRKVKNALFFFSYFMTPLLSALMAHLAFKAQEKQISLFLLLATLIYSFGVLAPTFFINVPMNDILARVDIRLPLEELATIWKNYSEAWIVWNAWRAFFASLALSCVVMSLTRNLKA